MFGSEVIDAAIGLFLVYFLFSLLCSAVNELIVGHLCSLRAKVLADAIGRMLGDADMKTEFFKHPLIRSLSKTDQAKPSYISAATFTDGLFALVETRANAANASAKQPALTNIASDVQLLRQALIAMPKSDTQMILQAILNGAPTLDDARKRLEQWFNEGMDRASGWYKKKVHWFVAVWALLVAVAFNVDTFSITRALLNNPKLRASLVAAAEATAKQSFVTSSNAAPEQTIAAIEEKIKNIELPIGWTPHPVAINGAPAPVGAKTTVLREGEKWSLKIAGLLVTAGALSLGAPFWFDLLNKLINLRAAGKKPEIPKPEEKKQP